jgi:hypothetical protein
MQSSHNDIRMFCFIQTHRHIGTSSINFYINHSMHSNCYYIYIYIERERERERESYVWIALFHSNTYILVHLVMKTIIKHVTHHYRAMHAFHSFFFPSWCHGVRSPMVFRFVVPRGTHPKGLVSWCQGVHNPTIFHFIVPRSTQHKGLVAWCSGVCIPRVFSSPFCFIYILELS